MHFKCLQADQTKSKTTNLKTFQNCDGVNEQNKLRSFN